MDGVTTYSQLGSGCVIPAKVGAQKSTDTDFRRNDRGEEEHARDSILSEIEQRTMVNRLTSRDEIGVYNDWIGVFSTICEVNHMAHIMYRSAEGNLRRLQYLLERFITAAVIEFQLKLRPLIVTEKQLEDLKAAQRKDSLKEEHTLEEIPYFRADRLLSDGGESL